MVVEWCPNQADCSCVVDDTCLHSEQAGSMCSLLTNYRKMIQFFLLATV